MTVIYRNARTGIVEVFMKGATEVVLPLLSNSDQVRDQICSIAENMAGEGLRVLCVAHKAISAEEDLSERHLVERNLQFAGLVGLYDLPRLGITEAVRRCQLAGITDICLLEIISEPQLHSAPNRHPQYNCSKCQSRDGNYVR